MRSVWCMTLALALSAAAPAFGDDAKNDALKKKWKEYTKKVDFVLNYDEAVAEAKFSGRPMMLFFTATW